jgi:hypothetical protein
MQKFNPSGNGGQLMFEFNKMLVAVTGRVGMAKIGYTLGPEKECGPKCKRANHNINCRGVELSFNFKLRSSGRSRSRSAEVNLAKGNRTALPPTYTWNT